MTYSIYGLYNTFFRSTHIWRIFFANTLLKHCKSTPSNISGTTLLTTTPISPFWLACNSQDTNSVICWSDWLWSSFRYVMSIRENGKRGKPSGNWILNDRHCRTIHRVFENIDRREQINMMVEISQNREHRIFPLLMKLAAQ